VLDLLLGALWELTFLRVPKELSKDFEVPKTSDHSCFKVEMLAAHLMSGLHKDCLVD
jgi:hypothetical protein